MTNSKLLQFLKTIDSTEHKALSDFLKVAKGAKDVNILFDYLKKYHPVYPENKVLKSFVANKIFPKDKNNEKKLLNTMVKFVQLLDEFFIKQELERTKIDRDFLYLKALRRRKLDSYFFRKADQMKEQWDKEPPAGLEHLHQEYRLTKMHYLHPAYKINRESQEAFEPLINKLDNYYFSVKLLWSLVLINNKIFFKTKTKNVKSKRLLDEIIRLINSKDFRAIPQIYLLSLLLKAFLSANFGDLQTLKNMIVDQLHLYDESERSLIFTLLDTGYFKSGKAETISKLFELNCLRIDQNCLLEEGYITYNRFSNVVNVGLVAKQIEWTENFIKEYIQFLPEEIRADALKISNAMLNFSKGAYKDALYLLVDIKYKNVLFSLYGRSIQLQCYYELNDYELFFGLTDSFSLYVKRADLFTEDTSNQFLNFIDFSKRLFRVKKGLNSIQHKTLNEDLNNCINVAYKNWLAEKLNDLNKTD